MESLKQMNYPVRENVDMKHHFNEIEKKVDSLKNDECKEENKKSDNPEDSHPVISKDKISKVKVPRTKSNADKGPVSNKKPSKQKTQPGSPKSPKPSSPKTKQSGNASGGSNKRSLKDMATKTSSVKQNSVTNASKPKYKAARKTVKQPQPLTADSDDDDSDILYSLANTNGELVEGSPDASTKESTPELEVSFKGNATQNSPTKVLLLKQNVKKVRPNAKTAVVQSVQPGNA